MAASPPLLRTTRRLQQTAETSPNNELKRKRAGRPGSWSKRRRTSPSPSASSTSPSASSIISSTSTCTSTDGDCDQLFVRQSLSAAMREHNRTRLYVQPIAWTCRHLMVLNVQFNLNPRLDACQHSLRVEGVPIKHEVLRAARQLRCESAEVQQIAMGEILKHYKLEELERTNRLELCYGGKKAARVLTDGIFKAESGLGRLACINLGTVRALRNEYIWQRNPLYLKRRKVQIPNGPVAGLQNKKLQRLKPAVEAEDPYILGVLISLAQKQRQERKKDVASDDGDVAEKVYAVAFPFIRARVAYFYKAVIPPAFLQKLEKPHEAISCGGFTVSYVPVSLAVPEEALNRLIQLFCSNELLHCAQALA